MMVTVRKDKYSFMFISLAHFFSGREMFQTKLIEKIKTLTHFILCNLFFRKSCRL